MKLKTPNTIEYLTPCEVEFSKNYIAVRNKEKRILSNREVSDIPKVVVNNIREWQFRKESSDRILNYLRSKNKPLKILDLGCGNGWLSNLMSQIENCTVIGIDINLIELEQANAVFHNDNLQFVYADIFKITDIDYNNKFDIITLNGSVQYFSDLKKLLEKLNSFLSPMGAIHIFDSPFYRKNNIILAKKRTFNYYNELGYPEMSKFYFHHLLTDLEPNIILYQPTKSMLKFYKKQNPFCWFMIHKKLI